MDNNELYKLLLKSSSQYVISRIDKKAQKRAFMETLEDLNRVYFINLEDLRIHVKDLIEITKQASNPFWDFHNTNKYRLLAYELSLDVIDSIVKRFESGGEGEVFLRFGGKL